MPLLFRWTATESVLSVIALIIVVVLVVLMSTKKPGPEGAKVSTESEQGESLETEPEVAEPEAEQEEP